MFKTHHGYIEDMAKIEGKIKKNKQRVPKLKSAKVWSLTILRGPPP